MKDAKLTIRSLRARAVRVPMPRPLQTGGGQITIAPLVLLDLETAEGITGCSYIFGYTPVTLRPIVQLLKEMEELLVDEQVAPLALGEKLQGRFRLLGTQGLVGMALAGIDIAAWDALAKVLELPLVRLLGGQERPVPAYNSCGLGMSNSKSVAAEAEEFVAAGFRAIKVRLGYPDVATDVAVVRAIRRAIGDDILIMSDYNQSLSVPEAQQRVRHLDDEGLFWIEEPTRADDYEGCARIRRAARTPIQIGENCWGPSDMAKALAAEASDFCMPDAIKIGGVTGWLRAIALAEPIGMPISSHLFPELSAHLLAITPTCHWLEYMDWANAILREPLTITDGNAVISQVPGNGLSWNEQAVAKYAL